MQDSNTYRQYANDCRRIAETMSAKDKAIMLEMAKVWDERADEAEREKAAKIEQIYGIAPECEATHDRCLEIGNFVAQLKFDIERALE